MRALTYIKVLVFLAMFIGVVYVMRHLNANSMNSAFSVLGIETGTSQAPGFKNANRPMGPGDDAYNICPTRIHSIRFPDDKKVEEHRQGLNLKWMALDPAPREISYMAVEKWLGQHCQIVIQKSAKPEPSPETQPKPTELPYVRIEYINGKQADFRVLGPGKFQATDGTEFSSEDFQQALNELREIAQFGKDES